MFCMQLVPHLSLDHLTTSVGLFTCTVFLEIHHAGDRLDPFACFCTLCHCFMTERHEGIQLMNARDSQQV